MKFLLIFVTFLSFTINAKCQAIQFRFSEDGQFLGVSPNVSSLPAKNLKLTIGNCISISFVKDTDDHYISDPKQPPNTCYLPVKYIKQVRKNLASRINLALKNLDKNPSWSNFYQSLSSKYSGVIEQLKHYKGELLANTDRINDSPYTEIRDLYRLENKLHDPTLPYESKVCYNTKKKQYEITLTKSDPFTASLLEYFKIEIAKYSLTKLEMNREYRESWREIRELTKEYRPYGAALQSLGQSPFACRDSPNDSLSKIAAFDSKLTEKMCSNEILKAFKSDLANVLQFLWFNHGFFGTDLIGLTTPDRMLIEYEVDEDKASLRDSILSQKARNAASCCNIPIRSIDSLLIQMDKGKETFMTGSAKDSIFGFNKFEDLETSKHILNILKLPIRAGHRPTYIYSYDASDNFSTPKRNAENRSIQEIDKASVCIHNIGLGKTIAISQQNVVASNTSSFQDALNDAGNLYTVAKGLPTSQLAAWQAAIPAIRGGSITVPKSASSPVSEEMAKGVEKFESSITIKAIDDTGNTYLLRIESGEREKKIISDYLETTRQNQNTDLLNYYYEKCHKNLQFPTKLDKTNIAIKFNKALADYIRFAKFNEARTKQISQLIQSLNKNYTIVHFLDFISDKSLPASIFEAIVDANPVFRTEIFPLHVPDSSVLINYTITEKKKGPDGTAVTDTSITDNLRVGKGQLFQFSAGISATMADFSQKTASTTGGQLNVAVNSDRISFVAGLHIYFAGKLFLPDDSFLGLTSRHFRNRVSFYVGVGLPDALKHYYTGLGLDFVPGLKLVGGAHLFLNNRYTIGNDRILDKAMGVQYAGPFISLNLDPVAIIKILGL